MKTGTVPRSALTLTALSVSVLLASGCASKDFKLSTTQDVDTAQTTAQAISNMDNYMASLETVDETQTESAENESHSEEPGLEKPNDIEHYLADVDGITTSMSTLEKHTVLASLSDVVIESPNVDSDIQNEYEHDLTEEMDAAEEPSIQTATAAEALPVSRPQAMTFHFPFDKSELDAQDIDTIKQHAQYLIQHPHLTLVIHGHTDNHGPAAYNQHLSELRAREVANLITAEGAAHDQIRWKGFGDTLPLTDPSKWAENRRVELLYQDNYLVSNQ